MAAPRVARALIAVVVLLNAIVVRKSDSQRLPSRDEGSFLLQSRHPEIFYDTKVIPDGAEVTSYLLKNGTLRFFFPVDDNDAPLKLMVTPCSSKINVQIVYQNIPKDSESDEDDDDEYNYEDDDEFADQDDIDSVLHQVSSRRPPTATRFPETVLMTATGRDDAVTYASRSVVSGLYSVIVTAVDRDTSIRLFATTASHGDAVVSSIIGSPLPVDRTVRLVRVLPNEIALAWKPIHPTSSLSGPVEYCLSVSSLRHFRTQCAAVGFLSGDPEPTAPPHAGFGFKWERDAARRQRERARQRQRAAAAAGKSSVSASRRDGGRQHLFYTCVGSETNYTYRNAVAGRRYYIDIYVVSSSTNVSRYYGRKNATTPPAAAPTSTRGDVVKAARLVDGREARVLLTSKQPVRWFEYRLQDRRRGASRTSSDASATANISLYFRSCSPSVETLPVSVVVEHHQGAPPTSSSPPPSWLPVSSTVIDEAYRVVMLTAPQPGTYRIRMETATSAVASQDSHRTMGRKKPVESSSITSRWTILVVANAPDNQYPILPSDLTIRPFDGGLQSESATGSGIAPTAASAGCRSVTVTWTLASDAPTQRYCLYTTDVSMMTSNYQLDACADPRRRLSSLKTKTKIACKVVHGSAVTGTAAGSSSRKESGVMSAEIGGGGGDGGGGGGDQRNTATVRGGSTMVQTVSGLRRQRQYAIEVYATRVSDDGSSGNATAVGQRFRVYDPLIWSTSNGC